MTQPDTSATGNVKEAKLPRRDWILLPLIGLLTICLLAGSVELIAMWMFPQLGTAGEDCMVYDPSTGSRGIPNSVCWEKIPEGELTEYRFNSCGHRAGMECGPKPSGTYRIVMIGTSFTLGMRVPREKTFAALLPLELSRRTGLKVELYNEAMPEESPDILAHRFSEVLKAEPDMVLWALNQGDIGSSKKGMNPPPISDSKSRLLVRAWHRVKAAYAQDSFMDFIRYIFRHTRTATLLSHFLYSSNSQFVKASLMSDDYQSEPSADRKKLLKEFDNDAASIEAQAINAGVPLVAVLLPNHAQAAMISMQELPAGVDPYWADEDVRSIITSHGGIYIDMFPDIRAIPNLQLGYFPVEGHPNALGHAIFTEALAQELTNGSVPALKVVAQPQAALEQSR
jgi:hypothetical protein